MNNRQAIAFWCFASLILIIASAITHPLMPQHETLYSGVAWEMWQQHHFFIPLLNGHTYDQKPPLLFWLTHAGWFLFGVNNWWPRIFPGFFGLTTLLVCQLISKTLWGKRDSWVASLIVLGSIYWTVCSTQFRFDTLVAFFGILSLYGVALAAQKKNYGWWIFGIASGLGILSKGPILFLYSFPPVILAPLWIKKETNWFHWYRNFALSLLLAVAILAIWAAPALSNKAYAKSVLWTQTMNRIDHKYAQHKSWLYYLCNLPVLFLPWLLWPSFWKTLIHCKKNQLDSGLRMLIISLLVGFIGICLIGPKETRYALTMAPIVALLLARLLQTETTNILSWDLKPIASLTFLLGTSFFLVSHIDQHLIPYIEHPWIWGTILIAASFALWRTTAKTYQQSVILITILSVILMLIYFFSIMTATGRNHDMRPMAKQVSQLQKKGLPVGFLNSRYQDEFQFYGRLKHPLTQLSKQNIKMWIKQHPNGWVVQVIKLQKITQKPVFSQAFGHNQLILWPVSRQ